MIGRKIVDRVDELLDAPQPPNNRYLQPPPLRIDTGRRRTTGAVPNVRVLLPSWHRLTPDCCSGVHEYDYKSP